MNESSFGKWPKKDARRVSCSCPFCVGRFVSPYASEDSTVERSLLCGPSEKVTMLRRLSVRDIRLITYTCTPHDSSMATSYSAQKVSSSYIAISSNSYIYYIAFSPLGENTRISESFGCIVSLLQHSFGGETYKFAGVNIIIWKGCQRQRLRNMECFRQISLIPLSGLSSPLTLA